MKPKNATDYAKYIKTFQIFKIYILKSDNLHKNKLLFGIKGTIFLSMTAQKCKAAVFFCLVI